MPVNNNERSREMIEKAMKCAATEDLMAMAKAKGVELSKEEAEAYLDILEDIERDGVFLNKVAGGLGD